MKFLVDADILSEPTKPNPTQRVVDWLRKHEPHLAVNPVILGEIEYGILRLPSGNKRTALLHWFASGNQRLSILDFDADTGHVWAQLLAELHRKGRMMPVKDSLIAATARRHKLTIATRNAAHFQYAGVQLVNPFAKR